MGRDSRRRADLRTGKRQPTEKEEQRAALKAQRRGRRYGNTLPEYETLAAQGEDRVYAALIARHAARMDNIAQSPAELREVAYDVLALIMCFDVVLRRYKASRSRHPSSYGGTWIDHLAWGVDSMVASIRLLLSGQFIGAALIARHQLERWSQNRAFTTDTPHRSGESSLDYIARVWSADSQPQRGADETADQLDASTLDLDDDPGSLSDENVDGHTHMTMSDGTEICPSAVMGILSEILHTREGIDAVKWDTADLCAPGKEPPVVYAAYLAVTDALRMCSAQIGAALTEVAEACGDATTVKLLATAPDRMSRIGADDEAAGIDADRVRAAANRRAWPEQKPGTIVPVPLAALLPLHPGHGLSAPFIGMLQDGSDLFEEVLAKRKPAGRLFRDDEMMNLSLVWASAFMCACRATRLGIRT